MRNRFVHFVVLAAVALTAASVFADVPKRHVTEPNAGHGTQQPAIRAG